MDHYRENTVSVCVGSGLCGRQVRAASYIFASASSLLHLLMGNTPGDAKSPPQTHYAPYRMGSDIACAPAKIRE